MKLPVEPVLRLIALGISLAIAATSGAAMIGEWPTLALFWYTRRTTGAPDPILGKSLTFFLFALPAWLILGWAFPVTNQTHREWTADNRAMMELRSVLGDYPPDGIDLCRRNRLLFRQSGHRAVAALPKALHILTEPWLGYRFEPGD